MSADGKGRNNHTPENDGGPLSIRIEDLEAVYDIGKQRGFLRPNPPIQRMPSESGFDELEAAADLVPSLLGVGRARPVLASLAEVDVGPLIESGDEPTLWRAMLVLSILSHAYIFEDQTLPGHQGHTPDDAGAGAGSSLGRPACDRLPRNLAVPWSRVAAALDIPPVISHAVIGVANYRLVSDLGGVGAGTDETEESPLGPDDLVLNNLFLGGMDEAWFFLVAIGVECVGWPVVLSLLRAHACVAVDDTAGVAENLAAAAARVPPMTDTFNRIRERCDPSIFYTRVRLFLSGSKGNSDLPNGLVMEGCGDDGSDLVVEHHGGSAAQACTVTAIDRALDIHHGDGFLDANLAHMPREHRAFLAALGSAPSLRDWLIAKREAGGDESAAAAVDAYNACVEAMCDFRSAHIRVVASYIVNQSRKTAEEGTGGSSIMPFLKGIRESTRQVLID